VWVNGREAGSHLGYVSEFEFDITELVTPGGTADIAVLVDAQHRPEVDPLMGCMDLIDHLYSYWGGLWGHVRLERRAPAWLGKLFVEPDAAAGRCAVSADLNGAAAAVEAVRLEIFGPDGSRAAFHEVPLANALAGGRVRIEVPLPGAPRWSPESPVLHRAELTLLRAGQAADRLATRFGVRTIEIRGHDFYVNGRKYFLNGYGDDAVFVDTIAPPSDKQVYLERLKVAKSYGFNFVRHHSHFMPPEYYEACDEIGMFVSPELPIAYPRYYERAKGKALDLYRQEWAGAITRYRNHPSIFNWCMGNELWEGIALGPELYALAKQLDPTRAVLDTDGIFPPGFIDGTKDRATKDYLTVMFDILTTPLENPRKFDTGVPLKPIVTHEEGNFAFFPQLDEIPLYADKPFKPFWLTSTRDRIARQGLLAETDRWSENSQKLYYLCHKLNLEALRKNPRLSGYHWWLLQPWYPGANGLLDVHRRPTSVTPEQVRPINSPVVLLQDGLDLNYRGGDALRLAFSVSNYSPDAFAPGRLSWRIERDGAVLRRDTLATPAVAQGAVAALGGMEFVLPDPAAPGKVRVVAELAVGGQTYRNEWDTWLYPRAPLPFRPTQPLFVSDDLARSLAAFAPRAIPAEGPLPAPAVYVARQPDARLLDAAERGACVVLLSPAGLFPTDVTTFKSAWWLGVFPGDSNAGTMVYPSPVTRELAPDGWCDAGWFHLLQGAQTVILDQLPAQPDVLIRALNTHDAPTRFTRELDYDFVWRNKSLLFETRVGRGSWIVSGLNFDAALRHGGPEGPWLLTRLLERAQSLPRPEKAIPLEALRAAVAGSPFATGALVSGFHRVLKHTGETATGVTYRENLGPHLRIRQEEPLHEVAWETAPVTAAGRTTFVFAGGTSFQRYVRGSLGFGLSFNGRPVIDFDATRDPTTWRSADGEYTLTYTPALHRSSWKETMGLFYLSVPASSVTVGAPARIRVHTIGYENARWFSLNPYTDVLDGGTMPLPH
jgi:hypothetical protein